jgi:uncharacterized protein YndB with AHSA1/START domain
MTDIRSGSTRLIGALRAEGEKGAVRVEDVYDTDAADLWRALTLPERLERWIATVRGELAPGGEFHIRFTSGWEGPGRVVVCEAPRRLEVVTGKGAEEETVIEAVLTPEGGVTRLVIEERGLPRAELSDHGAGWQAHAEDLAAYLAGGERSDWQARWNELRPAYRDAAVAGG